MMLAVGSRLLDVEATAAYLGGISAWTVRDLVTRGAIPTVKVPHDRNGEGRSMRRILIDRHDLDALIERWKQQEVAELPEVPVVRKRGRPRGSKNKTGCEVGR
jgi:hypothetical protein